MFQEKQNMVNNELYYFTLKSGLGPTQVCAYDSWRYRLVEFQYLLKYSVILSILQ